MKVNNIIWMRIITLIIIVTLLCPNSVLARQENYLAAQSRLSPFFSKHGLGVNNIGKVAMIVARLKKVLFGEIKADINNEIQDLNGFLSDTNIEIEKDIREYKFQCSERRVQYAVFNFKEVETKINAFFIKGHRNLTRPELEEIGISDEEIHHLDCPGLEEIWFVNAEKMADLRDYRRKDYALPLLAKERMIYLLGKEVVNLAEFLVIDGHGYSKEISKIRNDEIRIRDPHESVIALIVFFIMIRDFDHDFSEDVGRLNVGRVYGAMVGYDFNRAMNELDRDIKSIMSDEGRKVWVRQWANILVQNREISRQVAERLIGYWKKMDRNRLESIARDAGVAIEDIKYYVDYLEDTISTLREDLDLVVRGMTGEGLFETKISIDSKEFAAQIGDTKYYKFSELEKAIGREKAIKFVTMVAQLLYDELPRKQAFAVEFLKRFLELNFEDNYKVLLIQGKKIANHNELCSFVPEESLRTVILATVQVIIADEPSGQKADLLLRLSPPNVVHVSSRTVSAATKPAGPNEIERGIRATLEAIIETQVDSYMDRSSEYWLGIYRYYRDEIIPMFNQISNVITHNGFTGYESIADYFADLMKVPAAFLPNIFHATTWNNLLTNRRLAQEFKSQEVNIAVADAIVYYELEKDINKQLTDTKTRRGLNIPDGWDVSVTCTQRQDRGSFDLQINIKRPMAAFLSLPIGDVGQRIDPTELKGTRLIDYKDWSLLEKLGDKMAGIEEIMREQGVNVYIFDKIDNEKAPLVFRQGNNLYIRGDLEGFLEEGEAGRQFVLAELYHDLLGHDPRVAGDTQETAEEFFAFMAGELRILLGFEFPSKLTVESLKSALEDVLTDENIDRLAGIREMVVRKIRNGGDTEVDNILNALQRLKGKTGNRVKKLIEMIAESYGFKLEDGEIDEIISTTIKHQWTREEGIGRSVSQIGKRARVVKVEGDIVTARDSEGRIHTFKLIPQGELNINKLIGQFYSIPQLNPIFISVLRSLTEKIQLFCYDTLIEDLFGFAVPEGKFIAIHKLLKDDPMALFHEIGEYLVRTGEISMRIENGILFVKCKEKEFEVYMDAILYYWSPDEPAERRRIYNLMNSGDRDIATHYRLRFIQRMHMKRGEEDDRLTGLIRLVQDLEKSYGHRALQLANIILDKGEAATEDLIYILESSGRFIGYIKEGGGTIEDIDECLKIISRWLDNAVSARNVNEVIEAIMDIAGSIKDAGGGVDKIKECFEEVDNWLNKDVVNKVNIVRIFKTVARFTTMIQGMRGTASDIKELLAITGSWLDKRHIVTADNVTQVLWDITVISERIFESLVPIVISKTGDPYTIRPPDINVTDEIRNKVNSLLGCHKITAGNAGNFLGEIRILLIIIHTHYNANVVPWIDKIISLIDDNRITNENIAHFMENLSVVIEYVINGTIDKEYLDKGLDNLINLLVSGLYPGPNIITSGRTVSELEEELEFLQQGNYDPDNILHQELGYSLYLQMISKAHLQRTMSLTEFIKYNKLGLGHGNRGVADPKHKAELYYLAWEAYRLRQFIDNIKKRADEIGKEVIVVENLSYGGMALYPIKEDLRQEGIHVWSTKVGSSKSHDNPDIVNANLFTQEQLEFLVKEQPIVIVVDGSYSLDSEKMAGFIRHKPRYPDARQGYANYFAQIAKVLNPGYNVEEAFGLKYPLGKSPKREYALEHRKLAEMVSSIPSPGEGLYKMFYWYGGEMELWISEERKERELPEGLDLRRYEDLSHPIRGPTLIFAETSIEDDVVPGEVRRLAEGIKHNPCFFDDTDHFNRYYFVITPYGPKLDISYQLFARTAYQEIRSILDQKTEVIQSNTDSPYDLMLFDLDNTLADILKPVPDVILRQLYNFLSKGVQIGAITMQGLDELSNNLVGPLHAYLIRNRLNINVLANLHLFPSNGAFGFGFNADGNLTETYYGHTFKDLSQQRQVNGIIDRLMEGTDIKKADRGPIITLHNIRRGTRTDLIRRLEEELYEADITMSISKAGRHTLHISVPDIDKCLARNYMLSRFNPKPHRVLVIADGLFEGGADEKMFVPGGRNICVGKRAGTNVEKSIIAGWQGTSEILGDITHNTPMPIRLPTTPKATYYEDNRQEQPYAAAFLSLPIGDVGQKTDPKTLTTVIITKEYGNWTLLKKLDRKADRLIDIMKEQNITIHIFNMGDADQKAPLVFRRGGDLYVREDLEEFLDGTVEGRLFVLAELYHDLLGHDPRIAGDIHDTAEEFYAFMAGELRVLLGFMFPEELTVESLKSALENVLTDENIDRLAGIREMVVRKIRNGGDTEVDNILNALQRLKGKTGNRVKKLIELIAESYGFKLEDGEVDEIISTTIKRQEILSLLERQKPVVEEFVRRIHDDNVKDKHIILAWDNDIGTGEGYKKLLTELELKDLGNIHFVRAGRSDLQAEIEKKKSELKGETDVILIAKKNNIDALKDMESRYVMAVDDTEIQTGSYMPVLEILTFALTVVYDNGNKVEINRLYKEITGIDLTRDKYINEKTIEIIPKAIAVDIDQLGEVYKLSIALLIAA